MVILKIPTETASLLDLYDELAVSYDAAASASDLMQLVAHHIVSEVETTLPTPPRAVATVSSHSIVRSVRLPEHTSCVCIDFSFSQFNTPL